MTEREKKIVAWLDRLIADKLAINRSSVGDERVSSYYGVDALRSVKRGIEAGDYLIRPEPTIPASEWKNSPSVGH